MDREPKRLVTNSHIALVVEATLRLVLWATCFVVPSNASWAGSGERIVLPVSPRNAVHGVRLEVDTRWVDGNGYRPVRVRISTEPSVASAQERVFRVTISPVVVGGNRSGRARPTSPIVSKWASVAVTERVILPESELQGNATLMIPQSSRWQALQIRVEEDGVVLDECSDLEGYLLERELAEWTEVTPTVAVISREVPNWGNRTSGRWERGNDSSDGVTTLPQLAELAALVYQDRVVTISGPKSNAELQPMIAQLPKFEFLAPEDVPGNWIGLSCLDLIFIDLHDARQIAAGSPEKWNALRTWAESGQTLFVYGLEEGFADLAELETLLEIDTPLRPVASVMADMPMSVTDGAMEPDAFLALRDGMDRARASALAVAKHSGWSEPPRSNPQAMPGGLLDQVSPNYPYPLGNAMPAIGVRDRGGGGALDWQPAHRIHALGLGQVIAVAGSDPFLPRERLAWMFSSLKPNHWAWMVRHGFSLRRNNLDIRSFQIPGVGEPPRITYLVLITLFALAIGPLNYWALWRIRRLHLLLLTVPLAASLVTLLLLSYAMVRDGFQPRVFARSLTLLVQEQGRGVTWSTQAYYATLPPAEGLRFSAGSLVYPLDAEVQAHPGMSGSGRSPLELNWLSGQQLRGNYLRPRKTQHFAVISAGSQPARLVFDPQPGTWNVTNELGGKLHFLLVHAAPGEYFYTASIEAGEKKAVRPRGDSDARGDLLRLFQDYDPPVSSIVRESRSNYQPTIDANAVEPRLSAGILETWMNQIRTQPETVLAPRTYIAVIDWPVWLDVGVERVRREPGLHVILGHF